MAHLLSDVATVRIDDSTGSITDYSGSITSVSIDGGDSLVEDTGIGDSRRTEIADIKPVQSITFAGLLNSTTEALIAPLVEGTSLAKTVEVKLLSTQYISGEGLAEAVGHSIPIGLQTFSVTFHSADTTGFTRTSVASS
jgi:hypothetical protein